MNICYIGEFDFTRTDASTVRVIGCSKSIEYNSCHKVDIIGFSNTPYMKNNGFEIHNVKRGYTTLQKIYNTITRGYQIINMLKSLSPKDVIIYYGESAYLLSPLRRYCHKNNIKLVVDIVEWYDYKHLPMGKYGMPAYNTHRAITKIIPTCDGVIAISSYLEEYFRKRNVAKIIRVPIIIDSHKYNNNINRSFDSEYLNLIYAGFAGKKDLILNVALAVENLFAEGVKIKLHILGTTAEILQSASDHQFSDSIVCHGRIPQDQVQSYLSDADFSVLFRPQMRYANAGFPTKFVESLNAGLPVIANLTSDIGLYLKDGYNGYVVNGYGITEITDKLREISTLNKEMFSELRQNAKQSAIDNFDFRSYSKAFNTFLETL